jgi:hypothetical protein
MAASKLSSANQLQYTRQARGPLVLVQADLNCACNILDCARLQSARMCADINAMHMPLVQPPKLQDKATPVRVELSSSALLSA